MDLCSSNSFDSKYQCPMDTQSEKEDCSAEVCTDIEEIQRDFRELKGVNFGDPACETKVGKEKAKRVAASYKRIMNKTDNDPNEERKSTKIIMKLVEQR